MLDVQITENYLDCPSGHRADTHLFLFRDLEQSALRWLCRRGASSLCGIHQPWEQYSGPVSDSISKFLKDKAEALHPVSLFVEAVIYGVLLKLEARWNVGLPKGTFVHLRISEEHPGRKLSGRGGLVIFGTCLELFFLLALFVTNCKLERWSARP